MFAIAIGIAQCEPVLNHIQYHAAGVPLVRYESPLIPVYSTSSHSQVVNHPYVGAYQAAPIYSRQVRFCSDSTNSFIRVLFC